MSAEVVIYAGVSVLRIWKTCCHEILLHLLFRVAEDAVLTVNGLLMSICDKDNFMRIFMQKRSTNKADLIHQDNKQLTECHNKLDKLQRSFLNIFY